MTRRQLLAAAAFGEIALAQRGLPDIPVPPGTVWLNYNEFPGGPPRSSLEAMSKVLPETSRYHYQEIRTFYEAVARSAGFDRDHVLVGAGSSEIIHCAIDAFTAPARPLILCNPTYEMPPEVANALGHPVIRLPLTPKNSFDVKRLAEEARNAGGGLIFLCNPNNPTATITPKADIAWLVANLPPNTVLFLDEAYIHFADSPEIESGLRYVREGKDVIVARTFSKLYGMAGLRIGFAIAKPELIRKLQPFRDNIVNIVGVRAVLAALAEGDALVAERRSKNARVRSDLCGWLREKGFPYLESHANFMMIDVRREVRPLVTEMLKRGVGIGRPFPPMDTWMRVSMGVESDMEKFRKVLTEVVRA